MPVVLEVERLPVEALGTPGDRDVLNFVVRAADLMLLQVGSAAQVAAFADSFCGLDMPEKGAIRFLGHDWRNLRADEAAALRGLIGRLFARGGWVGYWSVEVNVLIQQLHHTRQATAAIRAEASQLAREFGLPGLPQNRPAELAPADLRRAAMIRAFLGKPRLIVLEEPAYDLHDLLLPPLLNAIGRAREHGAAVLWVSQTPADRLAAGPGSTGRLRVAPSGAVQVLS